MTHLEKPKKVLWARVTIKGDGLIYSVVLTHWFAALVIKYMVTTIPKDQLLKRVPSEKGIIYDN